MYVPAAGKLRVSGKGLSSQTKKASGRETLTFTLKQKKAGKLKTKLVEQAKPEPKAPVRRVLATCSDASSRPLAERIVLWQKLHLYSYGEHWMKVAITVFFALIGVVLWGTISGSMLPLLLKKLGADPAASSAPFVATLVDVTGLIIYFSVAYVVMAGTLL